MKIMEITKCKTANSAGILLLLLLLYSVEGDLMLSQPQNKLPLQYVVQYSSN